MQVTLADQNAINCKSPGKMEINRSVKPDQVQKTKKNKLLSHFSQILLIEKLFSSLQSCTKKTKVGNTLVADRNAPDTRDIWINSDCIEDL